MMRLVFFLEEASAEALLETFLPRILLSGIIFRCHVFEGKQDLEKQLPLKLRHYTGSNDEILKFIIMRDQDAGDCCNTSPI